MVAAAIELVHSSSLVHDDLPAMDDDDCRRGKPSTHKKYNEAIAILAGDALIFRAFEVMGMTGDCRVTREVAYASGTMGMVGGQVADIESSGKDIKRATIERVHDRKTGALIRVALRCGAIVAGAGRDKVSALDRYGKALGLAFQITDDMLDGARGEKLSYLRVYGIEGSKRILSRCVKEAMAELKIFGKEADILRGIAGYISERKK
jgi:geranylgeranyl diphosphate synthase type II